MIFYFLKLSVLELQSTVAREWAQGKLQVLSCASWFGLYGSKDLVAPLSGAVIIRLSKSALEFAECLLKVGLRYPDCFCSWHRSHF